MYGCLCSVHVINCCLEVVVACEIYNWLGLALRLGLGTGMRIFSFFSCPKFTQFYLFSARFWVFLPNFTHFFSFSDNVQFFSGKFIPMPAGSLYLFHEEIVKCEE